MTSRRETFRIEYTKDGKDKAIQVNKLDHARVLANTLKDRGHMDISIHKQDNEGNKELIQVVNPSPDPDITNEASGSNEAQDEG